MSFIKVKHIKILHISGISHMKKNKSTVRGGLTVEFYQTFWPKLKTYLANSINFGFTTSFPYTNRVTKKTLKIGGQYHFLTLILKLLQGQNI